MSFIDDASLIPGLKADTRPLGPVAANEIRAADFNAHRSALLDLRDVVIETTADVLALLSAMGTTATNFISVKQSPFNATGDGVTDDRVACAAARDAAIAAGLPLYFPPGVYLHSSGGRGCLQLIGVQNLVVFGVPGRSTIKAKPNTPVPVIIASSFDGLTLRGIRVDGNWGNAVTKTRNPSFVPAVPTLPQSTIYAEDTTRFPTSGKFSVVLETGLEVITYTSKTPDRFLGCTGGTHAMPAGSVVGLFDWGQKTTHVSASSNGVALPQATINVDSTTGFPPSGTVQIVSSSGAQQITYTSKTATAYLGCAGGVGTLVGSTGTPGDLSGSPVTYSTGGNQSVPVQVDAKNHGMFIYGSDAGGNNPTPNRRLVVEFCEFVDTFGDFLWIGADTKDFVIRDCYGRISARNGITLSNGADDGVIEGNDFDFCVTQMIDSEPVEGPTRNIRIANNTLGIWWNPAGGSEGNIAVTITGGTVGRFDEWNASLGWRVHDNLIKGSVAIHSSRDVQVRNNRIVIDNAAAAAGGAVYTFGDCDNSWIEDNSIYQRGGSTFNVYNIAAISLTEYAFNVNSGGQPRGIKVRGNKIDARHGLAGIAVWVPGGYSGAAGIAEAVTENGTGGGPDFATLRDDDATWLPHQWAGYPVVMGGVHAVIQDNTVTKLYLGRISGENNGYTLAWADPHGVPQPTPAAGPYKIVGRVSPVEISDNEIDCTDDGRGAGGKGIILDFTGEAPGRGLVICDDNTIRNASGEAIRVETGNDVTQRPQLLTLRRNVLIEDQGVPTCTIGVNFTDGAVSPTAGVYADKLILSGTSLVGNIATPYAGLAGQWLIEDGPQARAAGYGKPAGSTLLLPAGSTYSRLDGDIGQRFYVKSAVWEAMRPSAPTDWDSDSKSLVSRPANATEWAAFLAALGITSGGPTSLYLEQEASGAVLDKIGAFNLTAQGAGMLYQRVLSRQAAYAIGFDGTNNTWLGTTTGQLPASESILRVLLVDFGGTVETTENAWMSITSGGGNATFMSVGLGAGGKIRTYPGGQVSVFEYAGQNRGTIPVAVRFDRTAQTLTIFTPLEILVGTYIGAQVNQYAGIGDMHNYGTSPNAKISLDAVFKGPAAEKPTAELRTLFQGFGFSVAW